MARFLKTFAYLLGLDVKRRDHAARMKTDADYALRHLLLGAKDPIIFDVGANTGQSVHRFRMSFPTAVVHCFEPVGETWQKLNESFQHDNRVYRWRMALSDEDGDHRMFVNEDPTCSSLLEPSNVVQNNRLRSKLAVASTTQVTTQTLDGFCAANNVELIELLKLDIQGGEGKAIDGARRFLQEGRIRAVLTEVQFTPMYEGACLFGDVASRMRTYGYELYGIYDMHHFTSDGLLWGDALFISPHIRRRLSPEMAS
jgi:FkbM family methyltransferase